MRYIDIDRRVFILEGLQVAKATFGAITISELMDISYTDYEMIIDELRKENAERTR